MLPHSPTLWFAAVITCCLHTIATAEEAWQLTRTLAAPEAIQAAAADATFVYAIASRQIAKYERATGKRIGISSGEAKHLNSGFFWKQQLLCAHSNYPQVPERSEIKRFDPTSLKLTTFKDLGNVGGSLTWVVHHQGHWWCNFARYGDDNAQTFLVKYDPQWVERGRWVYPQTVIQQLGRYSLSGGLWYQNTLLVTGHDKPEVYRLQLPREGNTLKYLGKQSVPFSGQGFAIDPVSEGLVGIHRARRQVLFVQQGTPVPTSRPEPR